MLQYYILHFSVLCIFSLLSPIVSETAFPPLVLAKSSQKQTQAFLRHGSPIIFRKFANTQVFCKIQISKFSKNKLPKFRQHWGKMFSNKKALYFFLYAKLLWKPKLFNSPYCVLPMFWAWREVPTLTVFGLLYSCHFVFNYPSPTSAKFKKHDPQPISGALKERFRYSK